MHFLQREVDTLHREPRPRRTQSVISDQPQSRAASSLHIIHIHTALYSYSADQNRVRDDTETIHIDGVRVNTHTKDALDNLTERKKGDVMLHA